MHYSVWAFLAGSKDSRGTLKKKKKQALLHQRSSEELKELALFLECLQCRTEEQYLDLDTLMASASQ